MVERLPQSIRPKMAITRRKLFFGAGMGLVGQQFGLAAPDSVSGTTDCTLVELYPGYPGYTGFVTGVDGLGDHACLEDLEEDHPGFSRAAEDRANQRAAERLGIDGTFEDWTWENWLGIEAERGLYPVGYWYIMTSEADARRAPRVDFDPDDPRVLLGDLESRTLIARLYEETGNNLGPDWYDADLRILGALTARREYPNAPQILAGAEAVFEGMFQSGVYLDTGWYWDKAVRQGGWFPMHPNAVPEDQSFGIFGVLFALRFFYGADSWQMIQARLQGTVNEWMRSGAEEPLAEWLVDAGVTNWL